MSPRLLPALSRFLLASILAAGAGCNPFHRPPKLAERVDLIAVMPIEPIGRTSATPPVPAEAVAPGAAREVTAAVYGVLTSSSEWRVVPDLTVVQALGHLKREGDLASQARALGKEVGADAVLFGTVSRYVQRVGAQYAARHPASVAFTLNLVSVASGKILWTRSFDQTQQPLATNLFNWWQFWRGGPRWFTAQEFTRLGVERVLRDLSQRLG
jgi:TolB-like protein